MRKMRLVVLSGGCVLMMVVGIAAAGKMKGDVSVVNNKAESVTVKSEEKAVAESNVGTLPKNAGVKETAVVKQKVNVTKSSIGC